MKKESFFYKSKILTTTLIGLIVVIALGKYSIESENFFIQKNEIVKNIDNIKHSELMLNYTISASSIYLYKNNDSIIKSLDDLQKDINILLENKYFKKHYFEIYQDIQAYKKLINKKVNYVYEFQSYSSAVKNSTMYISLLLNKLPKLNYKLKNNKDKKYLIYRKKFVNAVSNIFLSKNSIDKDLLKNIDVEFFRNMKFKDAKLDRFNKVFVAHMNVFYKYYPEYNRLLLEITNPKTQQLLDAADKGIYKISKAKLSVMESFSYLLIVFILIYTIIVVFLLVKGEKENKELNMLGLELSKRVREDALTKLYNRYKFDEDTKDRNDLVLFLVNINKFKYINDYYGTDIGDMVLIKVANILKNIVLDKYDAKFYRLGADDFGVLIPNKQIVINDDISKSIINYFEISEIDIGEFQFKIGVSIGIHNDSKYLEKANIALKRVKESSRLKYLEYSESIDNSNAIIQNIEKTKVLYEALNDGRVVPYFQAIIDVKTQKIAKYEVLTRVINKDGRVESIYPYLQIAKDNKLYSKITEMVLRKSAEKFHDTDIAFNVNFSVEDIMDDSIIELLDEILQKYENIAKNITFELLESESVNDYDVIKNFIRDVKKYGSKVAIDDFGSGYSNFDHIINLDIDYIKIDGSLVKNIDTQESSYNIVKLVNQFAQDSGIETVAEFVENEDIYKVLQELGVNYAQGYYFAKPSADIIN